MPISSWIDGSVKPNGRPGPGKKYVETRGAKFDPGLSENPLDPTLEKNGGTPTVEAGDPRGVEFIHRLADRSGDGCVTIDEAAWFYKEAREHTLMPPGELPPEPPCATLQYMWVMRFEGNSLYGTVLAPGDEGVEQHRLAECIDRDTFSVLDKLIGKAQEALIYRSGSEDWHV
jgi:hypothetical protein